MNYLKQINDYWEKSREIEGMTPYTQSLYFALLYFANKQRKETFEVYRDDIMQVSHLAKNTYYKARDLLKESGLIDYGDGKNGNKKTQFTINPLSQINDTEKNLVSQELSQIEDTNPVPVSQVVSQNCDTLYNKSKHKHKEKKINSKQKELDRPILKPTFDEFFVLYDKQVGRGDAEMEWRKVKQEDREKLMDHVPLYVASTPEKKFRMHPANYLAGKHWNDEIIVKNGKDKSHNLKPNGTPPGKFTGGEKPEDIFISL